MIICPIAYGIDENGRKVYIENACKNVDYKCHYCSEKIYVRKGNKNKHGFSHRPIKNRTPEQMICPDYSGYGTGVQQIKSEADKIYIVNGGVPVHLVKYSEGYFELIAMFPPLSSNTMKQLEEWDVKVQITKDGTQQIYSATNLRRYRIKTTKDWIHIALINMHEYIYEVDKKWLWGIRGLSFENDLFKADFGGGARVAQHSNIIVGIEYLFVQRHGDVKNRNGLLFNKKGVLTFTNKIITETYDVYSVIVTKITDESIAFIQSKGYQLIEKNDELVPLWPPAVIEGNELIYSKENNYAYFYHKKESRQKIYSWDNTFPSPLNEKDDIIKTVTNNRALLLSDEEFNCLSKEIRFILTHNRSNYNQSKVFESQLHWNYGNGTIEDINEFIPQRLYKEKISLESNSNAVCLSVNNGYIEYSSIKFLEKIKRKRELYVINEPFKTLLLKDKKKKQGQEINHYAKNTIVNDAIWKLYHCQTAFVPIQNRLDRWIKSAISISPDLYEILMYWKNNGSMPCAAEMILIEMEKQLYEENCRLQYFGKTIR